MSDDPNNEKKSQFEQAGETESGGNLVKEFLDFLADNKKWWMLPIIVMLLLFGALMILGATGAAPFIYTLF